MTARKRTSSRKSPTRKVAASATAGCTQEQLCNYIKRLAPPHQLPAPGWANASPKNNWLEEFYDSYKMIYEAVVQLEAYVLCNTPAQRPQPKIATGCPPSGGNPPQKSGTPPPPPFP